MSHYTVHIKPCGYNLTVNANETVLAAALRQGYQFPHDCQSGTCGTCRGKIIEGQVTYDEPMFICLSEEEREAGYALFCSAKPLSDLQIYVEDVIGPNTLPQQTLSYTVQLHEKLSEHIHRFILQPPANAHIAYRAGQYVEILQRDKSPLPFSITNAPLHDDHSIELHIRHLPQHAETGDLITEIDATKMLKIRGPFGNCTLRNDPPYPAILLAGGTGFAPFKALIEQALADGLSQPLYLYWGARTFHDLYLHELVSRWAKHVPQFHYVPVLSEALPTDHWLGRTGLVHSAVLKDFANLTRFHVYASGPPEMIYAALRSFQEHGMQKQFLYSDLLDFVSLT